MITVIDNEAYKWSRNRRRMTIKWYVTSKPYKRFEVFKGVKTYDAAMKILSKRNKQLIITAFWNGHYLPVS